MDIWYNKIKGHNIKHLETRLNKTHECDNRTNSQNRGQ